MKPLYLDDELVAIAKPAGLSVHRGWAADGPFATDLVREVLGVKTVLPIHRLDRPTSGVLSSPARPRSPASPLRAGPRSQKPTSLSPAASRWGVRIYNDHSDCVAVKLGDLGRDMPLEERKYWRAFNMPPEGRGFSNSNFKRSLLVEDAVPQEPEHRFQAAYARIAEADPSVISWPLLLPLGKSDEHHIKTLHVPITDTQAEFDQQVLSLTNTMIDSLNVVQLKKFIVKQPDMKPIALCEEVCKTLSVEHYEKHTGFLRNLQSLRSMGEAHRKGSDYAKAVKRFDAVGKALPMVFRGILEQAIEFLDWVLTTFNVKLAGRS